MARIRNRLNAALRVLKEKSPNAIGRADKQALPSHWRIPTGSFDLDHRLSGGLKVGGVTLFWGDKSGGKTTSALRVLGIAQGLCRNCWRPAKRDGWIVISNLATIDSITSDVRGTVISRHESHAKLTEDGYEPVLDTQSEHGVVYAKGEVSAEDRVYALVIHQVGGVESVPPPEEELVEDSNARWGAKGWCDCFVVDDPEHDGMSLYDPEEPDRDALMEWGYIEGKKPPRNSKAHREALAAWNLDMSLNSYDEVVANWTDMEGSLDMVWAEKLGVDTRRMLLTLPDSAEDGIDLIATLIATNEVDIQVIDSIAQFTPEKEITESASDWQQGLLARLMNKAIRRWNQGSVSSWRHERRALTQIWINQKRTKIGVMFGSPDTMPGGLGQGFQVVAEVKWRHGKTETEGEQYGSKTEVIDTAIWEELHFEVSKDKAGGKRKTKGNYRMAMEDTDAYPAGTVLDFERIHKLAMDRLVEEKKKGSKKVYVLGDREYTSQSAIANDLREDPEMYQTVRTTLLNLVLRRS